MHDEVKRARRLPVGAEVLARGGVEFRVWAPRPKKVHLVIEGQAIDPEHPLDALLVSYRPGQTISITIRRDGQDMDVDVTLGTRPDDL